MERRGDICTNKTCCLQSKRYNTVKLTSIVLVFNVLRLDYNYKRFLSFFLRLVLVAYVPPINSLQDVFDMVF